MNQPARVDRNATLRVFLGLSLPVDTVERLARWQEAELAGRTVAPENLHITLAFLGGRPVREVEAIAAELRAAAGSALAPALTVRRYRETRSVGMLVFDDEGGRATALAEDVHGRLEGMGVYRRESRPWLPHITVLRFRERPLLVPALPDLGRVSPSEAAVYHSVLRSSGAQYVILEAVRLGG